MPLCNTCNQKECVALSFNNDCPNYVECNNKNHKMIAEAGRKIAAEIDRRAAEMIQRKPPEEIKVFNLKNMKQMNKDTSGSFDMLFDAIDSLGLKVSEIVKRTLHKQ